MSVKPLLMNLAIAGLVTTFFGQTLFGPACADEISATPSTALSGQVEVVELNLATLRDLGLDIKHVQHGAGTLMDEVSRQPVSIQTMPEVVGRNTIINLPVGFTGNGYVQPRKAAVDAAMGAMEPWIDLSKASVDAILEGHKKLDLDEDTKKELAPQFKEWVALVNSMYDHLQKLKVLAKKTPYDNEPMASEATAIYKDSKSLEKVRREIYKVLQREGKEASKAAAKGKKNS